MKPKPIRWRLLRCVHYLISLPLRPWVDLVVRLERRLWPDIGGGE